MQAVSVRVNRKREDTLEHQSYQRIFECDSQTQVAKAKVDKWEDVTI